MLSEPEVLSELARGEIAGETRTIVYIALTELLALRAENATLNAQLSEARGLLLRYAPINEDGNAPLDVERFLDGKEPSC